MNISVDRDGWASVNELADALGRKRSDLGIANSQQLREMLRDTDVEGRFEIDARGRIRKVQREFRLPRTTSFGSESAKAPSTPHLADRAEQNSGDSPVPYASVDIASADMPDNPPGKCWTKYTDDGTLWWYYEGPKGKWWMQSTDEKPQPWTEE